MVVCGSTLEGEETIVLDAWKVLMETVPKAVLVIAPRHTQRFEQVAALIHGRELALVRASTYARTQVAIRPGSVFLLDTIGDLSAMYGLAAAAFVGGSLVAAGGHNPLEPAQFGVPVLMGPSVENFREIVEAMREKDGIRMVSAATLADTFAEMLKDREQAHALGGRGRDVSAAQAGGGGANGDGAAQDIAAKAGRTGRKAVKPSGARKLLLPLIPTYAVVTAVKNWLVDRGVLPQRRLKHPVISVGSISTGGAGKTPVVLMLAELLEQRGFEVRILTRGYRRNGIAILRVDPEGDAKEFGDEPLLMARRLKKASVWVGTDRHRVGRMSERDEAPGRKIVYLLDDGFQHRKLARDVDIVLMTRKDLEDRMLPAGDLREPVKAVRRADVVVVREDEAVVASSVGSCPVWVIRRELKFSQGVALPSRPLAFCGLARPESFFSMLGAKGITVAAVSRFPDHHPYSGGDVDKLIEIARGSNADGFLTTEKDAVKLTAEMMGRLGAAGPVVVLQLRVELADEQARMDELMRMLGKES